MNLSLFLKKHFWKIFFLILILIIFYFLFFIEEPEPNGGNGGNGNQTQNITVERTFNCNPGEDADFYNDEACCGWSPPCSDSIIFHTYYFDDIYEIFQLTISTDFRRIYDSRINVHIDFLTASGWTEVATYNNLYGDPITQIIHLVPINASGLRVYGKDYYNYNPLFGYTYGSFIATIEVEI